jgi:hypothetical protein
MEPPERTLAVVGRMVMEVAAARMVPAALAVQADLEEMARLVAMVLALVGSAVSALAEARQEMEPAVVGIPAAERMVRAAAGFHQ